MATTLQPQPQIVQAPTPPQDSRVKRYHGRTVIVLSSIQVLLGLLCISSNSAGLALHAFLMAAAHGFWGGLFCIASGVLGILAGMKKTRCLIMSCIIVCIITFFASLTMLIMASIGMGVEPHNFSYVITPTSASSTSRYYYSYYDHQYDNTNLSSRLATNGLILAVSLVQIVLTSTVSGIGCCVLCCCAVEEGTVLSTTPLPQPLIVNQAHGQNVQLLLIQGQGNAQQIIPVQSSAQNEVHRSTAAQEEGYEVPLRHKNSLGPPSHNAPPPPRSRSQYEGLYESIHDPPQYLDLQHTED